MTHRTKKKPVNASTNMKRFSPCVMPSKGVGAWLGARAVCSATPGCPQRCTQAHAQTQVQSRAARARVDGGSAQESARHAPPCSAKLPLACHSACCGIFARVRVVSCTRARPARESRACRLQASCSRGQRTAAAAPRAPWLCACTSRACCVHGFGSGAWRWGQSYDATDDATDDALTRRSDVATGALSHARQCSPLRAACLEAARAALVVTAVRLQRRQDGSRLITLSGASVLGLVVGRVRVIQQLGVVWVAVIRGIATVQQL